MNVANRIVKYYFVYLFPFLWSFIAVKSNVKKLPRLFINYPHHVSIQISFALILLRRFAQKFDNLLVNKLIMVAGTKMTMKPQGQAYKDKTKPADIRKSNINAAKGKI